ncbi:hypothetical protein [Polaribacter porphyrae]|uniref:Uncharacterized protein n=1 Tax=Polaribacter porphyrae TaxID=1137780 RepID=A0A2S7WS94_9FLAO|nr:hypothetical protein [Polaribacter porphyrae]PQJ80465.1 hypothetical protein BTO18_15365 [Polaribacter porphyrae]
MKKSQILGIIIFIASIFLALLWDKQFKYADFFDFILGIVAALGASMVLKLFPVFRKLDK